jgi:hypothetical protein
MLCALMVGFRVMPIWPRVMRQDPYLLGIYVCIPYYMKLLMCHIFYIPILLYKVRDKEK